MQEHLTLTKDLPAGYTMRPATMDDAAAVVAVGNAAQKALNGYEPYSLDSTLNSWRMERFDLPRSVRVIENEQGKIIAFSSCWDMDQPPVTVWSSTRVHPDYLGLGLATNLHAWLEERAKDALPRVEQDIRVALRAGALSEDDQGKALLESVGFKQIRYFFKMSTMLDREIPEPVLPAGIVIRPWTEVEDRISLRDIIEATDDAFKDHWGHFEGDLDIWEEDWKAWLKDEDVDPAAWFLALDGDEITAMSLCSMKSSNIPDRGYLDTLGVRRSWRRKGLGLALLHHTFRYFQDLGYSQVDLHVDASSLTGATRLYERAGMSVSEQSESYEKELRPGRDVTKQSV